MARPRTVHRCAECGVAWPRWSGRCGACGEWNSLVLELDEPRREAPPVVAGAAAVPIADVDAADWSPRPTGLGELDRVLSGGLVPGSVTLVGGEPGIGKSTLLLQALASLARQGARGLVVSAEESAQQVRLRAERLGALEPGLWLVAETALPAILAAVAAVRPDYVVVDSAQTVYDPALGSAPGTVAQVRECAAQLVRVAKTAPGGAGAPPSARRRGWGPAGEISGAPDLDGAAGPAVVLVGHVTKEGSLAGPRVLEHVVDTVLSFEGERHHALRLLRASKHRFGSTGELGLFEMGEGGLQGVPDPGALFLGDRRADVAGSVVVPAMEGHRPLLVELQALVSGTDLPMPRRSAQGLDAGRLALLLAVLDRRAGLRFAGLDVYVSAVGGVRVAEPGADLALALALASALSGRALPPGLVACGEVGLGGEVRQVGHTARRLAEAARLGFTEAVLPASAPAAPAGMRARRVASVAEAIEVVGLLAPIGAPS